MKKRRKKKFSLKKTLRILIPLTIIIILLVNKNKITYFYLSKTTGYPEDTIEVFFEKDIYKNIKNKKYSKTLEEIINTEYYKPKYTDEYIDIVYCEENNFFKNITNLLELGYNANDINIIYKRLNAQSISLIIDNNYQKNISNIINLSYFKEDNLERYLKYLEKEELDEETAVRYVNIGLDNDYYTNVNEIENQDDLLVLVNKYHKLANNYVPNDLETINSKYQWNGRSNQLRKDARIAFEEMCEAATKDNIYIYAGSGYRSYSTQLTLYNNYVKRDGFKSAETYSARAGYSEHQTGLAMDVTNKYDYISEDDKEYAWLIDNAYKYGYILRYPKGQEDITGYMYEEWHFRYVGKDTSKELYEKKITYDEYIAIK